MDEEEEIAPVEAAPVLEQTTQSSKGIAFTYQVKKGDLLKEEFPFISIHLMLTNIMVLHVRIRLSSC